MRETFSKFFERNLKMRNRCCETIYGHRLLNSAATDVKVLRSPSHV